MNEQLEFLEEQNYDIENEIDEVEYNIKEADEEIDDKWQEIEDKEYRIDECREKQSDLFEELEEKYSELNLQDEFIGNNIGLSEEVGDLHDELNGIGRYRMVDY
jgi:chromosome segregation ATPase